MAVMAIPQARSKVLAAVDEIYNFWTPLLIVLAYRAVPVPVRGWIVRQFGHNPAMSSSHHALLGIRLGAGWTAFTEGMLNSTDSWQ